MKDEAHSARGKVQRPLLVAPPGYLTQRWQAANDTFRLLLAIRLKVQERLAAYLGFSSLWQWGMIIQPLGNPSNKLRFAF